MKIQIINSQGHWVNGWFLDTKILQTTVDILLQAGFEVKIDEVANLPQLEQLLVGISSDTLIWSNAYYVNAPQNQVIWLNDLIEQNQLPLIGSGATALRQVLNKDECQAILAKESVPIPDYVVVTAPQLDNLPEMLEASSLGFPMILKPTSESSSIGVVKVHSLEQAMTQARQILKQFPWGHLIIEEFVPGDEFTCGVVQLGEEMLLLPTYYELDDILDRQTRLNAWDNGGKEQLIITDEQIRDQLKLHMPTLIQALNIQDISRVDGRVDTEGIIRFFDINGLPGLAFPRSISIKQCLTCFPDYTPQKVYEALLYTILHNALLRYDLPVPQRLQSHNFFTLKSDIVIKGELVNYN
ncbi:MAG TPA: hypothetical protein DCS93_23715 [Microscillaceae bacterium]|nr:hypothetical protein [Microscillaceae bacterium]